MENCVVNENINNDFLSQSYSQGIERITGTKEHITDFQLPKELLEIREKIWQNLLDKYMEEMSDEIELNVDTLEPDPDEDQNDEEIAEENDDRFSKGCRNGQRAPMRKPAFLVQYWIDTGNPPYKMLLDKDELSETGSSLSEKEITPMHISSLSAFVVNGNASDIVNLCNKHNSDSSCSSVDTAVYILSNANVTKKADTIAIIEGAKHADESSRDFVKATNVLSDDRIVCMGTISGDDVICNNDSDADTLNNAAAERAASEPRGQQAPDTVMTSNAPDSSQNSCRDEIDKNDMALTNQRNVDLRNVDDIASIFEHFDKTSKRLSQDAKTDDAASDDELLGKDSSRSEQVLPNNITKSISEDDSNLTLLHRKKLYTGRNSPVDLILTKKHGMNRISEGRKTLHPALDTECKIDKKLQSARKGKIKRERNSEARKGEKRRKCSTSNKKTANIDMDNIGDKVITDGIQNSTINTSSNGVSDMRHDVSLRNDNGTNIAIKNKTLVHDLASRNLNPVVRLERITSSFKQGTSDSIKNDTQKRAHVDTSKKLYTCNIESLELETIDSDESTILICKCKKNKHHISSSNQRLLYSSIEDDSISDARENDKDELSSLQNLKSTDIKLKKRALVVLKRLSPSQYHKNCTTEKPQDPNVSGVTCQKVMLDTTTMHSSSLHDIANKKDNVKLPELKIVLECLPTNVHVEKSSNVNDTSSSDDEKIISRNISMRRKKRTQIRTNISVRENIKTRSSVQTARKVDNNNCSSSTSNGIFEQENPTLDKVESNSISQHESVNEFQRGKYSVLSSISSDEDDFTRLIQGTKKKLKTSADDEANKTKFVDSNSHEKTKLVSKNKKFSPKNTGVVIQSSRKLASKKANRFINKKNRLSRGSMITSSDSASTDSLQNKSEIFSVLPSETDNNNSASNLDKRRKRKVSFLNFSTDNSEKHSSITSRNKIDYKDDSRVILFQTKTFYTDSSDSERSDSLAVKSNHKIATEINNSARRSSRYCDHTNKKNFFDDSITKKYNQADSSSLNSVTNRMRDVIRSTSVASKKANINKRFANGEFNDSINSETSMDSSAVRNKHSFKKSKRSAVQQEDAKSVTKLLTFQTKSYYDSDSSFSNL